MRRNERYRGRLRMESTDDPLSEPGAAKDSFFYMGWYENRYRPEVYSWLDGAVGVHFHPLAAQSLHDADASWAAGALDDGLTCTMGTVHPTPPVAMNAVRNLFQYLQMGYTWAESAYMSVRFLSWQHVVIGDPLYRPFR